MLLLVLGLIPLFLGNKEGGVSETENRTLQAAPQFSLSAWFDGSFMSELETYLSDQMIGRDGILSASRGILGVGIKVRGGHHRSDALIEGCLQHFKRHFNRLTAVVHFRQDVTVDIEHGGTPLII